MIQRVGLVCENSIEFVDKLLYIWNSGYSAILIDWRIPFNEIHSLLREANAFKCYIEDKLLNKNNITNGDIEYETIHINYDRIPIISNEIKEKYNNNYSMDEAIVFYSSGTTGRSKGIILSHYAISKNADAINKYMRLNENDSIYIIKSLAHSSTLTGELLVGLKSKANITLSPTFISPRNMLNNIIKYKITIMCVNPTLLLFFSDVLKSEKYEFRTLRVIYTSGSIAYKELIDKSIKLFGNTKIYNVYGLSEAGPRVTAQVDYSGVNGNVGKPIDGVKIKVISAEGQECINGQEGIVHVKTPSQMIGYVSGNKKRKSLYNDWLNTGDIGYIDKNNDLFIIGRSDNMIIMGSHNVYPEQIEEKFLRNNIFSDCIVIGVDNKIYGQKLVCLYTKSHENKYFNKFLKDNFAPYEIPKEFLEVSDLPKTKNGKNSRKLAYELYIKSIQKK